MLKVNDHFNAALSVVTEAHEGQTRADKTTPYIVHPTDVARRIREKIESMTYPEVAAAAARYGLTADELFLAALLVGLGHDVKEDKPGFPLKERWIAAGIPENVVTVAIASIDLLSNTTGGDYLDYLLYLRSEGDWLALIAKEEDMNSNWDDIDRIPSKGRQKSMRTKYLLGHFILFDRKPYSALK
jgi:hypothetical protein